MLPPGQGWVIGAADAMAMMGVVAGGGGGGLCEEEVELGWMGRRAGLGWWRDGVEAAEAKGGWGLSVGWRLDEVARRRRGPAAAQGWQRRGDAEARGADFDASDGGARRRFEVGGVDFEILTSYVNG